MSNRVLICPPDHYGIKYEINPWMSKARQVNHHVAMQQWQTFRQALQTAGAEITEITPGVDTPDMVFTANAGIVIGKTVILSQFRYAERRGEEPLFRDWFRANGYDVIVPFSSEYTFEGAGDLLPIGDMLIGGYGFRSNQEVYPAISAALDKRIIPCQLIDPYFYHLDTCFSPLNSQQAVIYLDAFSADSITALRNAGIELLPVPAAEAKHFVCNMVTIGKQIIMPSDCPVTKAMLENLGFSIIEVPVTEYIKAGGACRCLTLFI